MGGWVRSGVVPATNALFLTSGVKIVASNEGNP